MSNTKISIRFFNDREVRAVWDEGNRAMKFLDWFLYSDNSLDGQSKKKAYTLFEGNILDNIEVGTAKGLQQVHAYLFRRTP